jgi:group I intron endonuclease
MDDCVIYVAWCVCHPEGGIRYVGQTCKTLKTRRSVHLWNARTPEAKSYRSPLSNWIRKHGEENVAFTVLEVCTRNDLNEREIAWIALFRQQGYPLLNVLNGGDQPRGHKRPEHSKRMSGTGNPMYGKDRSDLMAYARSFQGPASEETRKKMSDSRRGERNGKAKLTEANVRDIRSRYAGKWPHGARSRVAREFGISVTMLTDIIERRSWKHVE